MSPHTHTHTAPHPDAIPRPPPRRPAYRCGKEMRRWDVHSDEGV